jgi:hypothetical protein
MHQTVAGKMVFAHATKPLESPKQKTDHSNIQPTLSIRDRMAHRPRQSKHHPH